MKVSKYFKELLFDIFPDYLDKNQKENKLPGLLEIFNPKMVYKQKIHLNVSQTKSDNHYSPRCQILDFPLREPHQPHPRPLQIIQLMNALSPITPRRINQKLRVRCKNQFL